MGGPTHLWKVNSVTLQDLPFVTSTIVSGLRRLTTSTPMEWKPDPSNPSLLLKCRGPHDRPYVLAARGSIESKELRALGIFINASPSEMTIHIYSSIVDQVAETGRKDPKSASDYWWLLVI